MKMHFVLLSIGLIGFGLWAPATPVHSADTARVVFYVA